MANKPSQKNYTNQPSYQATVGTPTKASTSNDRSWNRGYLALAEVTKIYPKRNTAEIKVFHTEDTISSKDELEGKNAAIIGVGSAGFDETYQMPYGEITPLYRGNIVLVGFLKNSADKPILIRVIHDTNESTGHTNFRNILPGEYDPASNTGDITDYLHISPVQDFTKIDRFGNIEMASHTKSFFVVRNKLDDENFDFEDLSVKFPLNKSVINPLSHINEDAQSMSADSESYYSGDTDTSTLEVGTIHVKEKWSKPKKWMAVFRDNFSDKLTNWLRVIVDAAKTSLRILKVQRKTFTQGASLSELMDGKVGSCTLAEIDANGTLHFRRQMDTRTITDYTIPLTDENPTQSPSKQFSSIQMLANGGIMIQAVDKTKTVGDTTVGQDGSTDSDTTYPHTLVYIAPGGGGISIETTSQLIASAKKGVAVTTDESIVLSAKKNIQMMAEENIVMMCQSNSDTSSSTVFQMTREGSLSASAKTGDTNTASSSSTPTKQLLRATPSTKVTAGFTLNAGDLGAAAITTSSAGVSTAMALGGDNGGSATMMTKNGETTVATAMSGEGSVTTTTGGSTIKMDGSKVTTQGGKIESYGSHKSVGNGETLGNQKFVGRQTINGRTAVLQGDRDSHGYRNFAIFGKALAQIAASMVISRATDMVMSKLPGVAALSGMVTSAMSMYNSFSAMNWNGNAADTALQLTGTLINPNGPFGAQFAQYAANLPGGVNSVQWGMQFLTDPNGLNIDMETLATEALSMTPMAGTLHTTMALYNSFGQPNSMDALVNTGMNMADGMLAATAITFTPENVSNMALNAACSKINVQFEPNAFNMDTVGEAGDPTDMLNDLVNVSGLIVPGAKKTTTSGGGGGQGGGGTTTITVATVGDAVNEMATWAPGIKDQILVAAQAYDQEHGTNTAAYVNLNAKKTTTTGGGGGQGQGGSGNTTVTIGPAPIENQDQYLAQYIESTVLASYKSALTATNNAAKSYVSSREVPDSLTTEEKEQQANTIAGLAAGDPSNQTGEANQING